MKHRNGIFERLASRSELSECTKKLLQTLDEYLKFYDLFNLTNEREVFQLLYFQKESNVSVQMKCNISKSTLNRYIKKYDYMAKKLIANDYNFIGLKIVYP